MALSEATLAEITSQVASRLTGTILGREASRASITEIEIAGAAVVFCCDIAPAAPEAILREASIRLAGWLFGNRPHVVEHEFTDPSGSATKLRFNNSAATANGYRASGASALLARYVKRRAGIIAGTSAAAGGSVASAAARAAAAAADLGTTVMRAGFSVTLPFADTAFRWIGTANGIELDSSWAQPSSFALWLPGDLMSRVVEVVLLRSLFTGPDPDTVNLAAFGPAVEYQYGDTVGQLRYTAVTFQGAFSLPNDIRAVLGELR